MTEEVNGALGVGQTPSSQPRSESFAIFAYALAVDKDKENGAILIAASIVPVIRLRGRLRPYPFSSNGGT